MKYRRVLVGFILFSLFIGLMIYYNLDYNNHDPSSWYIIKNYDKYTTNNVQLDGVVTNVDKTNHTLFVQVGSTQESIIIVKTTESLNTTQKGDIVEVYGNFTSKNHMNAEKILIYEKWKYNLIFIRSLPAIPFALYLFFKAYHFNTSTYCFERRKKNA